MATDTVVGYAMKYYVNLPDLQVKSVFPDDNAIWEILNYAVDRTSFKAMDMNIVCHSCLE
jgi:hypothetical protein